MPALQVRDMPEELYGCLKNSAKTNHRSLAQETIYMLEKSLIPAQEKTLQENGLQKNDPQESVLTHPQENQHRFRASGEVARERIEIRREVFAVLSQINAREREVTSKKIEQICEECKQEFDSRAAIPANIFTDISADAQADAPADNYAENQTNVHANASKTARTNSKRSLA